MKLSIGQIQGLLRQAGWPEDLIIDAAAVFYYESAHGETTAHKVDSIERSYGLAQINLGLPGSRLAQERAAWGPPERLYDPLYNLSLALQIFQQQGWNAWHNTYYGRRYRTYLAASQAAYNASTATPWNVAAGIEGQQDYADWSTSGDSADVYSSSQFFDSSAGIGTVAVVAGAIGLLFLIIWIRD